jgi:hypothetical protein
VVGFLVLDNEFTIEFLLSNTTEQSVHCSCPLRVYLVGDIKFYSQMSGREDRAAAGACGACFISQNGDHSEKTLILSLKNRRSAEQ